MGTVDLAFDHGAQYFTARDPRFIACVDDWLRERVVAKWTGRIVAFDDEGWEEIESGTERYVAVPSMSALGAHLSQGLTVQLQRQGRAPRADWTPRPARGGSARARQRSWASSIA